MLCWIFDVGLWGFWANPCATCDNLSWDRVQRLLQCISLLVRLQVCSDSFLFSPLPLYFHRQVTKIIRPSLARGPALTIIPGPAVGILLGMSGSGWVMAGHGSFQIPGAGRRGGSFAQWPLTTRLSLWCHWSTSNELKNNTRTEAEKGMNEKKRR